MPSPSTKGPTAPGASRRRRPSPLYLFAAITTVMACASTGGRASTGNRDVLTREEIMGTSASDLLEVVRRLRPSWLRTRGVSSAQGGAQIAVFMDGVRMGDSPRFLSSLRPENVIEMRYVNARDATTRWGTGFPSGVIEVITR